MVPHQVDAHPQGEVPQGVPAEEFLGRTFSAAVRRFDGLGYLLERGAPLSRDKSDDDRTVIRPMSNESVNETEGVIL